MIHQRTVNHLHRIIDLQVGDGLQLHVGEILQESFDRIDFIGTNDSGFFEPIDIVKHTGDFCGTPKVLWAYPDKDIGFEKRFVHDLTSIGPTTLHFVNGTVRFEATITEPFVYLFFPTWFGIQYVPIGIWRFGWIMMRRFTTFVVVPVGASWRICRSSLMKLVLFILAGLLI